MSDIPNGWIARPATAFDTFVGPLCFRTEPGPGHCGFLADERHGNRWGVVHGGMLITVFDVSLGISSRLAAEQRLCATVQLNVHFVSAMKIGDFAVVHPEVIRVTRGLVFARGLMVVGDRTIAMADGVFKLLVGPPQDGSERPG